MHATDPLQLSHSFHNRHRVSEEHAAVGRRAGVFRLPPEPDPKGHQDLRPPRRNHSLS